MTWYTVVAIVFGLVAPVPSFVLALRMSEWAKSRLGESGDDNVGRMIVTAVVWIVFVVAFFAYAGPVLSYCWEWFITALHSTPVELPK